MKKLRISPNINARPKGSVIILWLLVFSLGISQIQRWVYSYNSPTNGTDYALKIAYGSNNNLYTIGRSQGSSTGVDYTVISLTNSGNMRWVYLYGSVPDQLDYGVDIVYGLDGNIYTSGCAFYGNFAVISLTDSGTQRWLYADTSIDQNGIANSLVYGPDSNIYAVGYTSEDGRNLDFTVISLSADNGMRKWRYTMDGTAHNWDEATDVLFGQDNNIYACGFVMNNITNRDFAVVSLTADSGYLRWFCSYNSPIDGGDEATAITYGLDGNVYVSGWITDANGYANLVVMSFDTNGTRNWVYTYDGIGNGHDMPYSIVYGADNNIYVAGRSEGLLSGDYDIVVISITNTGNERWVYRCSGPVNDWDEAFSLVYGADNNIYVAGYTWPSTGVTDFTVISLTNTGSERWIYLYNGPANSEDEAWDVAYGLDGHIYATGRSSGINSGYDITVISLTATGDITENYSNSCVRNMLKVYPNPAKTVICVRCPLTAKEIRIFDVSGKVIKEIITPSARNDDVATVSLKGINPGIYFLQFGNQTQKFQVVK